MDSTNNDSGRIFLRDGFIHYESDIYATWSLPLSSVRAIGEFTNQDGPGVDDWFLLFLTSDTAFEASRYAEDCDQFLKDLSSSLGAEVTCSLAPSTDFRSHLVWPPRLKGHRLFEYEAKSFRPVVESRIPPDVWHAINKS